MNGEIKLNSEKVIKRKKRFKIAKLVLLILFIVLTLSYLLFTLIYNGYNFTVTLDKNLYYDNNIIIYDSLEYKTFREQLTVESLPYFDNIKSTWLPDNVDEGLGTHNGKNYMAYSFYIENMGNDTVDYYSEMLIDDVIKNVDNAIRVRLYFDDKVVTYAKKASNGQNEKDCESFKDDSTVFTQHVEKFKPGEKHKYTVVIWVEGTDKECTDNIIGGEFRVHMVFNSEFKDGGKDGK